MRAVRRLVKLAMPGGMVPVNPFAHVHGCSMLSSGSTMIARLPRWGSDVTEWGSTAVNLFACNPSDRSCCSEPIELGTVLERVLYARERCFKACSEPKDAGNVPINAICSRTNDDRLCKDPSDGGNVWLAQ